jgi:hypothetical protein
MPSVWTGVAEERAAHILETVMAERSLTPEHGSISIPTTQYDDRGDNPVPFFMSEHDIPIEIVGSTTYDQGIHTSTIGCPNCFAPITKEIRCPVCGLPLDPTLMSMLRQVSFESVYFGWVYRTEYEDQLKHKSSAPRRPHRLHLLPPPTAELTWLGSIVAAGIIGGVAYDAVKHAVTSARKQFQATIKYARVRGGPRTVGRYPLTNDEQLELFIEYMRTYLEPFMKDDSDLRPVFMLAALTSAANLQKHLTGEPIDLNLPLDRIVEIAEKLVPEARWLASSPTELAIKASFLSVLIQRNNFKSESKWAKYVRNQVRQAARGSAEPTPSDD